MLLDHKCYIVSKAVYFPLDGATFVGIFGLNNTAEFVGCIHEKFSKSCLPNPNTLFWYLLLFWTSDTQGLDNQVPN